MRGHARRILRWSPIEILSVSSIRGIADLASVASPTGAALFGAGSCGNNSGLRVFGILADEVDYAVHGIGAPQSRARASDHFNPVDILEHYVLHIPVDARKKRCIHAPPVDEDQQLVVEPAIKSSRCNGPLVLIDARHFQTWDKSQRFRNTLGARPSNIFLSNHKDSGRRVRHLLRSP